MFEIFEFFIHGEWIYLNNRMFSLINRLSDQEKQEFNCNVLTIKWSDYLLKYVRGMQIWVMNYDLTLPEAKLDQIVLQNYRGFEEFKQSMRALQSPYKNSNMFTQKIL